MPQNKKDVLDTFNISGDTYKDTEIWRVIQDISNDLLNDEEILLAAVQNNYMAMRYLETQQVAITKKVALAAIANEQNVNFYNNYESMTVEFLNDTLKNDEDIAIAAFKKNWKAIKYLSGNIRESKKFALKCLTNFENHSDESFGMDATLETIKYFSTELQNNKWIVLSFLSMHSGVFLKLNECMKQDQHVKLLSDIQNCVNPKLTYKIDKNYYYSVALDDMSQKNVLCKFLSFGSLSGRISGSDSDKTLCDDLLNVIASYLDLKSLLAFRSSSVGIDSHIFKSYNYGISFADSEYRHHLISKIEQDTNNEYIVTLANEEVDILGT